MSVDSRPARLVQASEPKHITGLTGLELRVVGLGPVDRPEDLLELLVLVAECRRLLAEPFLLQDVVDSDLFGFAVQSDLANDCK